eukprot:5114718-Pyramimonas_sp.AAC.1
MVYGLRLWLLKRLKHVGHAHNQHMPRGRLEGNAAYALRTKPPIFLVPILATMNQTVMSPDRGYLLVA